MIQREWFVIRTSMKAVLAAMVFLGGGAADYSKAENAPDVAHVDATWSALVDAQVGRIPFDLDEVMELFRMRRDEKGETPYRKNWSSEGFSLRDGVSVSSARLSIATRPDPPELIAFVLIFGGRCVSFDEVKQHYPDIGTPLPSSPYDKIVSTTWSFAKERAIIYFEMEEIDGNECLRRVAFGPSNK